MPSSVTAGFGTVGIACPPCDAHDRRALLEEEAGHRQITSSAPSLTVTAGPVMSDRRALAVADRDAGVGDGDERAGRRLEQDAAGRARHVADEQRVLARPSGRRSAAGRAARPGPAPGPPRPIPRSSRPRSGSPGCPARTRSTPSSRSRARRRSRTGCPRTAGTAWPSVEGRMLDTSGTCTISRPVCSGSTLSMTMPRYLPKYLFASLMASLSTAGPAPPAGWRSGRCA